MGQITINGEIYGTNSTRDILDKNNRVLQEVLDESNVIHKEITQEEYDKLENAENDGILYFITDGMSEEGYDFNKNLAEAFDVTKDYKLAEYCIFNNKLYRFIEAKPAGDWNESKVAQAIVMTDFHTLLVYLNEMQTKVDDCFQSVSNGKTLIASAITDQGVTTAQDATFETMETNIRKIKIGVDTSGTTATSADITVGKTAWVNGVLVTGTRPAPIKYLTGSKSQNIANGASVTWTFTFSTPFDTTPTVTWTANFTLSGGSVYNVSKTGFSFTGTLRSGEWSTSEYVTFNWTATV